jgi:hypothetical protein
VKQVKLFVATLPLCESGFLVMGNVHTMNLKCFFRGGEGIRFALEFTIQFYPFTVSLKEFSFLC